MKTVPYVTDVDLIPCVWDLEKFLQPFVRTVHDFANVHHFWVHKNAEGKFFKSDCPLCCHLCKILW